MAQNTLQLDVRFGKEPVFRKLKNDGEMVSVWCRYQRSGDWGGYGNVAVVSFDPSVVDKFRDLQQGTEALVTGALDQNSYKPEGSERRRFETQVLAIDIQVTRLPGQPAARNGEAPTAEQPHEKAEAAANGTTTDSSRKRAAAQAGAK